MYQKKPVVVSRFVLARMRRGLRCWNVADAVNISRPRMFKIERGQCSPSETELVAIADFLRFQVGFFSRPPVELPLSIYARALLRFSGFTRGAFAWSGRGTFQTPSQMRLKVPRHI